MRKRSLIAAIAVGVLFVGNLASAESVEEQAVARQIAESLRQSGQLKDYRVGVKYQDGVAWLLGTVASQQQLTTAVNLTRDMPSVSHVVNKLEISGVRTALQVEDRGNDSIPHPLQLASTQAPPQPSNTTRKPAAHNTPAARDMSNSRLRARKANQFPSQRSVPNGFVPLPRGGQPRSQTPLPAGQPIRLIRDRAQQADYVASNPSRSGRYGRGMGPVPTAYVPGGGAVAANYDQAHMPGYAWPSYASYPNYAGLTYPQQYSPTAWPYIGPFYPYPQVPLGWRKVSLEWDDGWWFLDFSDTQTH